MKIPEAVLVRPRLHCVGTVLIMDERKQDVYSLTKCVKSIPVSLLLFLPAFPSCSPSSIHIIAKTKHA